MEKSTSELLEMMKNCNDYRRYAGENGEQLTATMHIDRALNVLLKEKQLKKSDVIARSGIEIHYAYQIFSGVKKPTRDKVIMLCFGFGISAEETQQLLKITGLAPLYAKNERDNAVLFGLVRGISIIEMNCLLDELSLELLI